MKHNTPHNIRLAALLLLLPLMLLLLPSCAKVALEGGDKPIHIVMDINIRVDEELERFFAFEERYRTGAATQPTATTQPLEAAATATGDATERSMP